MCFSAEVSFASAAVLFPTGVYCLRIALRRRPRLWPIAVVPAVFGVQQACEGVVWLELDHDIEAVVNNVGAGYLFFALAFWPFWFSLAPTLMEPPGKTRRFLAVWTFLSTGWFWLAYLPLLTDPLGASARVHHDSIEYEYVEVNTESALVRWGLRGLYLVTATVPLVVSSWRRVLAIPMLLGVSSAVVAMLLYDQAFLSVWCLFAAMLSASFLYAILRADQPRPPHVELALLTPLRSARQ